MDNKEKKGLSPKAKKITSIVVMSLQVAIVIATVVISIFVWTTTGRGETSIKKMQILAIRSNSMKGDKADSFVAGDLVIIKAPPKNVQKLDPETVITYKRVTDTTSTLVTHRIKYILDDGSAGGNVVYKTQGDYSNETDPYTVQHGDVVGVYSTKIKGLGGVMLWLQGYKKVPIAGGHGWDYAGNTNNFLWVIIIPLIALLLWNGYSLVKVVVDGKIKREREAALALAKQSAVDQLDAEEIKRRAVEEYLASLNNAGEIQNTGDTVDTSDVQADTSDVQADTSEVQADTGEVQADTGEGEQESKETLDNAPQVKAKPKTTAPKATTAKAAAPKTTTTVAKPKTTTAKATTAKTTTAKTTKKEDKR